MTVWNKVFCCKTRTSSKVVMTYDQEDLKLVLFIFLRGVARLNIKYLYTYISQRREKVLSFCFVWLGRCETCWIYQRWLSKPSIYHSVHHAAYFPRETSKSYTDKHRRRFARIKRCARFETHDILKPIAIIFIVTHRFGRFPRPVVMILTGTYHIYLIDFIFSIRIPRISCRLRETENTISALFRYF